MTVTKKTVVYVALALGCLIILVLDFRLGVFVGLEKAQFGSRWDEHYRRNILGSPMMFGLPGPGLNAHGVVGPIVSIQGNTLVVKGEDAEKTIVVPANAAILGRPHERLDFSALKVGEQVSVIGGPNSEGQIEARLVRILP